MSLKFFIFGLSTYVKMINCQFVERYSELGRRITGWLEGTAVWPELDEAVELSARDNVLFTPYMQRRALEAIAAEFLNEGGLGKWLEKYPECGDGSRVCGVVAAGNIPAVAFQDVLSVLAAGWRPVVKLSSKDRYLLPVLFPDVEFCGSVSGWHADALITMGGDAAAEYFRKNFPEGYEMRPLMTAAEDFAVRCLGRPAVDNHRRNKAVLTLAGETFLDSGTVIFRHLDGDSPYGQSLQVGEVWYSEYRRHADVDKFIRANEDRIQKIIRNFGYAQRPALDDWPDGVDVVGFLGGLENKKL